MAAAVPDITSLNLTVQKERDPHLPSISNALGFTGIPPPRSQGPQDPPLARRTPHTALLCLWGLPWEHAAAGWGMGTGGRGQLLPSTGLSELTQACFPGVRVGVGCSGEPPSRPSAHTPVWLSQSGWLNLPGPMNHPPN